MDFDVGLLDGDRPSSEWLLHTEVYERCGAGAVVHTHSIAATAVSLLVDELPAVHYYIARLSGPIPVVPYATYGSEELARAASEALVGRHAVILRNHGAVTTGADIDEAMRHAELLEWLCDLYLRAAAVGRPKTLSAEDLDAVRRQPARIAARGYRRA